MSKKRSKSFDNLFSGNTDTDSIQALTDAGYGSLTEIQKRFDGRIRIDDEGTMTIGRIRMSRIGLDPNTVMDEDEIETVGEILGLLQGSLAWLIGDFMLICERQYGKTTKEVADAFGLEPGTVHTYTWLCRKVDFSIRLDNLSPEVHRVVATMNQADQRYWLQIASDNGWSVRALRAAIKEQNALPAPQRKHILDIAPKLNNTVRKLFVKAQSGDDKAAGKVRDWLTNMRQWLDEVESQLD